MAKIRDYDEASIRSQGDFAERFFTDFDTQSKKFKQSTLFSDISFDILQKRNALDNYILKTYSKLDNNNPADAAIKRNMNKYLQAMYKRFISNPSELIGSPFLSSPNIVDTYCPAQAQIQGQTVDLRNAVKAAYRGVIKDKKLLYTRDKNLDNLSRGETDILMHALITSIGTEDKQVQGYQEAYIKKLISQRRKVNELSPKQVEFIAKYVNNLMITSRLKELGYSPDEIKCHIYVGEDRPTLGGFENGYSIYLNRNSTLNTYIPDLIQTVCHETEHAIQEFEANKNPNSKIGLDLAISNVLREYFTVEKNYDVYHNNYRFEQIEQDSENTGFQRARLILNMLGFKGDSDYLRNVKSRTVGSRRFEYDYRTDEQGKKCTREKFFYKYLSEAITRSPDTLKKYPSLQVLYKQDGRPKSFEELISSDFVLNSDSKSKIPEDFCKYYINQGALDTLDLSKFPEEVQANIASRLISILGGESNQISMMGTPQQQYYSDITTSDKKGVENFHLVISKNIMRFMNKNYQYLMSLQDKGKFSSIINMDYYNSNARAFSFDRLYENLAFDDPAKIEIIKKLAIEAEERKNEYRASKTQQTTFNPNELKSSFDILVADTRLSGFKQATHEIKGLPDKSKQTGLEEK